MRTRCLTLGIWVFTALSSLTIAAGADRASPEPIPNATEYRNVRYLPDWRYPEEGETHRTQQMVMDIVVPNDGKAEHPVLFVVHGGGWSAGTKDEKIYRDIMAYFAKRGYATVGFNYILRPREIFPQVIWDMQTAIRFLRANAEKYQADPTRFGAIGISAGGWLISLVGHASGDLFVQGHQHGPHIGELWERDWQRWDEDWNESFPRPMVHPRPVYPDQYGRLQAVSMDFHSRMANASGNSPAFNNWTGKGAKMRSHEQAAAEKGEFDYSETQWIHPKYAGRNVHVPPLYKRLRDGQNEAAVIGFDGRPYADGIEAIFRFFQDAFYDNPRTPVPEFRPTWRFFDGSQKVSFVMPEMEHEIRYQVLPLKKPKGKRWYETYPPVEGDAWKNWKVYDGPFELTGDRLVRAVATSDGRRPSTVAEAHFFEGKVDPPQVIAPEGEQLPPAKTGVPYQVTFTSDAESARWFMAGDLVAWRRKDENYYPNGMMLDPKTGVWSGAPVRPGTYWIQVWVNEENGRVPGYRDYTWTVTGADLLPGADLYRTEPKDPFAELLYMPESNIRPGRLAPPLHEHGIRCAIDEDGRGAMILVPEANKAEARRVIERMLEQWKYRGELHWKD